MNRSKNGFSMVEVSMALGLVSFAMLGILGLLPVGLKTVQQAMLQSIEASISRNVRGDVQQLSFSSFSSFASRTYYYSQTGDRVSGLSDAFYTATFSFSNPTVAGAASTFNSNARVLKVTLHYPALAPAANQKTRVISLLLAGQ